MFSKRISLIIAFLAMGIASMAIQAIVIREFLVVFYGNELCMGLIFGVWLLSISLGACGYTFFSKRFIVNQGIFPGLLFLFSLLPFAQVYLIRSCRIFLGVPPGGYIPFFSMCLAAFVVIVPYGIIVGSAFPLGCRFYAKEENDSGSIATIFSVESAGALIGGGVFSFLLVERFSSYEIIWGLLVLFLISIGIYIWAFYERAKRLYLTSLVLMLLPAAYIFLPFTQSFEKKTILRRWRSLASGLPLVLSIDSRYQNLALAKQEDQYSVFGNGGYDFSFPDPYQDKITANFILSEHRSPKKLLIIGMVSGGFISECLKNHLDSIHYVLLDRALMEMIRPYLDPGEKNGFDNEKVKIFYTDGRYWVNQAKDSYDVVYLALPDPSTSMLNRFYTKEFFSSLGQVVDERGIVALSLTSSSNYLGQDVTDYNISLYATLKEIFPFIAISPGEENTYFACRVPGVVTEDIEELKQRIVSRGIKEEDFSPWLLEELFYPERVEFVKSSFKERKIIINSDLKPVSYFYNLLLWDRFSGSKLATCLKGLMSLRLFHIFIFLLLLLLARALHVIFGRISPSRQEKFNILTLVAIFGFSAMGIEIVLIFSYQNIFGYLYQMIGVLVASFMCGLTLGSWGGRMLLEKKKESRGLLIALQFFLMLFSIVLPSALTGFSHDMLKMTGFGAGQTIYMAGIVVVGMLNGVVFPLASGMLLKKEEHIGKIAALVDAADHLGASLGGLLFGTLLVPLLGIGYSCALITMLCALGALLWAIIPLFERLGISTEVA